MAQYINPYSRAEQILGTIQSKVISHLCSLALESSRHENVIPSFDTLVDSIIKGKISTNDSEIGSDIGFLRSFARYLISLGSRDAFRADPFLFAHLVTSGQDRFERLDREDAFREYSSDRTVPHGYRLIRRSRAQIINDLSTRVFTAEGTYRAYKEETSIERSNITLGREWFRSLNAMFWPWVMNWSDFRRFTEGQTEQRDTFLLPEVRFDELLMEYLTGTWLGLFFCGERYDQLFSVVNRIDVENTGGLPSGCCVYKAYGDVYREAKQTAERIKLEDWSDQQPVARIRTVCRRPVIFGEPDFTDERVKDLTPWWFRSLGSLYLYWMVAGYLRSNYQATIVFPGDILTQMLCTDHSKLLNRRKKVQSDEINVAGVYWGQWALLALGPYREEWNEKRPTLPEGLAHNLSIYAIAEGEIEKLELQRGVAGIRRGAISGGLGMQSRVDLPFTGRRIYGERLATYHWGYRELALYADSTENEFRKQIDSYSDLSLDQRVAKVIEAFDTDKAVTVNLIDLLYDRVGARVGIRP